MKFPPLAEQSCSTCRYFRSCGNAGRCHRHAPQIGPRGSEWPTVDQCDWCGEWVQLEATNA